NSLLIFFIQAEDGIRDRNVTGVQTCALPILYESALPPIGVIGDTSCSLLPQVSLITCSISSTRLPSTPDKNVVLPALKNPPVVEIGRASCMERILYWDLFITLIDYYTNCICI